MWDYASMDAALRRHGFVDIRQAKLGDSGDPRIDAVERIDRFLDNGIEECAIDCRRPTLEWSRGDDNKAGWDAICSNLPVKAAV
jgi:hypothetical protein